MVVAAGFALTLRAEVAVPILQVNKLRPKEANRLIRTRMNMVWKLGRRHTRSHWPWTQGRCRE